MYRAVTVGAAAVIMTAGQWAPAEAAAPGTPVYIVAHEDFTAESSDFESTIAGCEAGTVVNEDEATHFTPWGGVFVGSKVFTCDDGEAGFTLRLKARFGDGSTGSWNVTDGWGDLDGLKGSGGLVGIPISETSIDDIYTGTLR